MAKIKIKIYTPDGPKTFDFKKLIESAKKNGLEELYCNFMPPIDIRLGNKVRKLPRRFLWKIKIL